MMQKKNVKIGQYIKLPKNTVAWFVKTQRELQAEQDSDRAAGRWCDDAGEPILYSNLSFVAEPEKLYVTIASKRPTWNHYRKKPAHLIQGTCDEGRTVLFVLPGNKK